MFSEDSKDKLLKQIELSGATVPERGINPIIVVNGIRGDMKPVLNNNSGLPRLQTNVGKHFSLILNQPSSLKPLNPFEVRCCLCHKVVTYPAWHYRLAYVINHLHYFICFDKDNPTKPTMKCYKRVI